MLSCAGWLLAFLLCTPTLPVALTAQAPPGTRPPVQDKGSAAIRGQVLVADEGTPVARLLVFVLRFDDSAAGPLPRYSATTDEQGRFEIRDLPAGRYSVMAPLPFERPQFVLDESARRPTVELTEGERREDVVLTVRRAGVIVVRAVNQFGEPIVGAQVAALRVVPDGDEPQATGTRQTDDLGRVRLFGLPAGDYYVRVEQQRRGGFLEGADSQSVGYLPTYHPGVLALDDAAVLHVGPGQEVGEIEISVRRGRTFRVSGVVVNSRGAVAPGASVFYRFGHSGTGATVRPDGTFSISGLTPGEYTFHATTMTPQMMENDAEASAPLAVQVEADIDGLTLAMRRAARVAGRVTVQDDSTQVDLASMVVRAQTTDPTMPLGPPAVSQVRPDGTFALSRLFGPAVVRVDIVPPWFLRAVRYKGSDITDEPVEFTDSPDPKYLELVVANRGALLRAHVRDSTGAAAADGFVLLFAADPKKRLPGSTMTRVTGIGRDGVATLEGLRPGAYLALAFDSMGPFAGRREQDAMFEHLAPLATGVELLEDDSREISLTLVVTPR